MLVSVLLTSPADLTGLFCSLFYSLLSSRVAEIPESFTSGMALGGLEAGVNGR